jgi:hypothetical protein
MPISASSKPFLTKSSFDFYSDVSKNGLLIHWNFSNLNCINYTNPLTTQISNLVSNGTGGGFFLSGNVGVNWSGGYIENSPLRGVVSSTTFIESNNKITIEWVGRLTSGSAAGNNILSKTDSFRISTVNFAGIYYFSFAIAIGGGVFATMNMISKPIVLNRTYYVTATFDGSTMKLFVYDATTGMTTQTSSQTTTLSPTTDVFTVNGSSVAYSTRSIKFYNRILNDTEIFYNRRYLSYF